MNELAAIEPQSEASSLMEVVSRAAADPNTDVAKLERLMALYERVSATKAHQLFSAAMTATQLEITRIAADASNPQTHSRYASYAQLDRALRPIYTKHGFALSFDTGDGQPDYVRVLCYVSHVGGHSHTYKIDMPADGKGAKGGDVMTKTHAVGSGFTYGQRYLLKGIFNIAVGEDDDGNATSRAPGDKNPQPNRMTAATKWASDAEAMLATFKTDKELSEWHRKNANAIAEVRPLNETAHKRLIEAISKRSAELSPLVS